LAEQVAVREEISWGKLTQLGIGLGANSVLLKFSRTAESEADALGSHIMAEAGYDPIEMAHLFQKLEATGGSGRLQFLSDHPIPAIAFRPFKLKSALFRSASMDTRPAIFNA